MNFVARGTTGNGAYQFPTPFYPDQIGRQLKAWWGQPQLASTRSFQFWLPRNGIQLYWCPRFLRPDQMMRVFIPGAEVYAVPETAQNLLPVLVSGTGTGNGSGGKGSGGSDSVGLKGTDASLQSAMDDRKCLNCVGKCVCVKFELSINVTATAHATTSLSMNHSSLSLPVPVLSPRCMICGASSSPHSPIQHTNSDCSQTVLDISSPNSRGGGSGFDYPYGGCELERGCTADATSCYGGMADENGYRRQCRGTGYHGHDTVREKAFYRRLPCGGWLVAVFYGSPETVAAAYAEDWKLSSPHTLTRLSELNEINPKSSSPVRIDYLTFKDQMLELSYYLLNPKVYTSSCEWSNSDTAI